jgi:mannose-6-phosphate isomerase-like protein (cupin superfamily)
MPAYRLVTSATRIPVPGGKVIEELFGRINTKTSHFSLAHMVAPPGWSEPPQTPGFGELTIMVRGRMRVEAGSDSVVLEAGQALWTEPGLRVRYSNPFAEPNEYFAVCLPAFTPDLAHREPG